MTNSETVRRNRTHPSSFVLRHSFGIRHSCFVICNVHRSRRESPIFPHRFFADKNKLCSLGFKWLQFPAARHEIEKLRAIGEADETLRANQARRQAIRKAFETIARKNFAGSECERFEFRLMLGVAAVRFFSPVRFRTKVLDQSCNARCEQLPRWD